MRSIKLSALLGGAILFGCNSSQAPTPKESATPTGTPTLQLKATTAQLMNWILDPHADIVWASVGSIITKEGEQQLAPKTEADWVAVRNAAATVAEASKALEEAKTKQTTASTKADSLRARGAIRRGAIEARRARLGTRNGHPRDA